MNNESRTRAPGWRVVVALLVALVIVSCGVYNAIAPNHQGAIRGARFTGRIVTSVRSGSPWAKAGVAPGDRLTPASSQLAGYARAGETYSIRLWHGASLRTVSLRAAPAGDMPAGRIADLIVEFASCVFAIIVLLRARRDDVAGALCGFTMSLAASAAFADFLVTAPTPLAAGLLNGAAQSIAQVFNTYFVFRLIGVFPHEGMSAQRLALRIAPLMALTAPLWALAKYFGDWLFLFPAASCVVGFVLLLWITLHAAPEHRARVRWFASTLLLFQFLGAAIQSVDGFAHFAPPTMVIVLFYVTNLGAIGPIYATLRHRVVDLDVVISRSAIYAAVSVFIVGLFIGAEWIAQRIADAFAAGSERGLTVELVSFGAALAVGLSVRHVHAAIERRINRVFFATRTQRLESLKRFAYEADISDTREALLNLTYDTLSRCIETRSVALYVAKGGGFSLIRASEAATPEAVDKNDRLVLRLLRWPQTFQFDDAGALCGRLIVPLMLRTNVIGFIALGAKDDHTRYLPEEIAALEAVAHHVATSYAFISSTLERLHVVPALGTA